MTAQGRKAGPASSFLCCAICGCPNSLRAPHAGRRQELHSGRNLRAGWALVALSTGALRPRNTAHCERIPCPRLGAEASQNGQVPRRHSSRLLRHISFPREAVLLCRTIAATRSTKGDSGTMKMLMLVPAQTARWPVVQATQILGCRSEQCNPQLPAIGGRSRAGSTLRRSGCATLFALGFLQGSCETEDLFGAVQESLVTVAYGRATLTCRQACAVASR